MTISTNDRRKTYVGNGVATAFNGPRAFLASHIEVFTGTHPSYNLVPPSQYTVTGLRANASTITFNAAPALNLDILILRTVPLDQPADITNQGAFLPEIHEDAFDYRVMQLQQLQDSGMQLVQDPDTGEFVWDAKGNRLVNLKAGTNDTDAVNVGQMQTYVEEAGSGGVGVSPRIYDWTGDGDSTDFPMVGANVSDPLFYDVAQETAAGSGEYTVLRPGADFSVLLDLGPANAAIRLVSPPADGVRGFAVLRGYARPSTGPAPLTTTAFNVVSISSDAVLDGSMHNALIVVNSASDVTLTIRANTGAPQDWARGEYFSVIQLGTGKVRLAVQAPGTLQAPSNFINETRAVGCIVSATCLAPDADSWASAGDLLRQAANPDYQCFPIDDRSVLIGTNITAGTGKACFVLPYGLALNSIAQGGCYASVSEAQATGLVLTVDVNRNGVSILSTKLTFDNAEKTTRTAATPAVYAAGGNTLSAGDEITIDVDQIGTSAAKGLTVYLVGQRIS